jgi:hypothetical protein
MACKQDTTSIFKKAGLNFQGAMVQVKTTVLSLGAKKKLLQEILDIQYASAC